MSDYIKRTDVLKTLKSISIRRRKLPYDETEFCIKCIPSADVVERKRGEWIVRGNSAICPICGYNDSLNKEGLMYIALAGDKFANFCPNCGADMRGAE